jgi:hypothetical protein
MFRNYIPTREPQFLPSLFYRSCIKYDETWIGIHFWATFSQKHLVTLLPSHIQRLQLDVFLSARSGHLLCRQIWQFLKRGELQKAALSYSTIFSLLFSRVTRLRVIVYSGQFFENDKCGPQFWGYFFPRLRLYNYDEKSGWGYISDYFF